MPEIFRLQCVEEDPEHPILDCYESNDPTEIAKLFASHTKPKKVTAMYYQEPLGQPAPVITPVPGIGASSSAASLINVLARLGLVEYEKVADLQAYANHNLPTGVSVSVYDLDRRLKTTGASVTQRMEFKNSLSHFNMLHVPR